MSSAPTGVAEGSARTAASNARPRSLDAFFVMRALEPLRTRLEATKTAEFAAAKATRVAQQELLEHESELGLKRRRVEPDEEDRQWHRWGYTDWTRQETWTQARRAVPLQEGVNALPPRDGEFGSLHHWRRGGVGWVQDWSCGSIPNAVRSHATSRTATSGRRAAASRRRSRWRSTYAPPSAQAIGLRRTAT